MPVGSIPAPIADDIQVAGAKADSKSQVSLSSCALAALIINYNCIAGEDESMWENWMVGALSTVGVAIEGQI